MSFEANMTGRFNGVKSTYIRKNQEGKFIVSPTIEPFFETYEEAENYALKNGYQVSEKIGNIFITVCDPTKVFQE